MKATGQARPEEGGSALPLPLRQLPSDTLWLLCAKERGQREDLCLERRQGRAGCVCVCVCVCETRSCTCISNRCVGQNMLWVSECFLVCIFLYVYGEYVYLLLRVSVCVFTHDCAPVLGVCVVYMGM